MSHLVHVAPFHPLVHSRVQHRACIITVDRPQPCWITTLVLSPNLLQRSNVGDSLRLVPCQGATTLHIIAGLASLQGAVR